MLINFLGSLGNNFPQYLNNNIIDYILFGKDFTSFPYPVNKDGPLFKEEEKEEGKGCYITWSNIFGSRCFLHLIVHRKLVQDDINQVLENTVIHKSIHTSFFVQLEQNDEGGSKLKIGAETSGLV